MMVFFRAGCVGLLLITLIGCAGPGSSAPESSRAQDPTESQEVAQSDENKLICTRETVVGSNFAKRVCRTRHQIEVERKEREAMLDRDATLQPRSGEN